MVQGGARQPWPPTVAAVPKWNPFLVNGDGVRRRGVRGVSTPAKRSGRRDRDRLRGLPTMDMAASLAKEATLDARGRPAS